MQRPERRLTLALLLLGGVLLAPDLAAGSLMAGAAKRELIPPMPVPLAGYSRRHGELATGVHDPLFVRALVVEDADTRSAIVSCDLLVIDEFVFDAVRARLRESGEAATMLVLAATHTHSGPGAYGKNVLERTSMGPFNRAVFDFIVGRVTETVLAASAQLQPVTVRVASAQTAGLVVNRMLDDGLVDPEVSVAVFQNPSRESVAILVNFQAHPTTLGAWNMQLSADYPGVLAQAIEARYPSSVCLFFAGAVGDQGPVKRGDEPFAPAEWLGSQLAQHVVTLVERAATSRASSAVMAQQRIVTLPPARLRLGIIRLPSWLGRRLVDDDATLTAVAVGPLMVIGVPCDLSAELGLELKAHARQHGWHPFIVGFANDYIGYCLPERLYDTKTYESSMAFHGPTTGPRLVSELKNMIDHLSE